MDKIPIFHSLLLYTLVTSNVLEFMFFWGVGVLFASSQYGLLWTGVISEDGSGGNPEWMNIIILFLFFFFLKYINIYLFQSFYNANHHSTASTPESLRYFCLLSSFKR